MDVANWKTRLADVTDLSSEGKLAVINWFKAHIHEPESGTKSKV